MNDVRITPTANGPSLVLAGVGDVTGGQHLRWVVEL